MPAYTTESEGSSGRRQVILALAFLGLALVLTYLPSGPQQAVASALRVSVLRPFVATQEGLVTTRDRAVETDELRTQLDSMVAVLSASQITMEENQRLRSLLSLAGRVGPSYRPATLIRSGTAGSESMFLLNVGESDGVHANAPVITRHGLLGVVREVQGGTAIGMDWTHPDFRASAMTLDGVTFGIAESRRGDFRGDDRMVLNGTAFHTTLDEGTVVVTSGLGGIYPRGIPIGTVEELAESEAGWRKSYWLRPLVDPGAATHVLVATSRGDSVATAPAAPGDLSSVWPADSIVPYETLADRDRARRDSLAALGDSVRILRQLLLTYQVQDSAQLAAIQAAQRDSLARAGRAAAAAGASVPRPQAPAAATPSPAPAAATPTRQAPSGGGGGGATPTAQPRPATPQPQPSQPAPSQPERSQPTPSQPTPSQPTPTPRQPVIRPAVPPRDTVTAPAIRPAFPTPTDTIQVGGAPRDTVPPRDTLGAGPREGQGGAPST